MIKYPTKSHPHTEEFKEKRRLQYSGSGNPNYGKKHIVSDEIKLKLSIAAKGKKQSLEWVKKRIETKLKTHPCMSEETKLKIGKANKGRLVGNKNYFYNKHYHVTGENHPSWRGGTSKETYPCEFNHKLKETVRERDGYLCQLCKNEQLNQRLAIHHIDYNKNNLELSNLVSLCHKCHSKTNSNRNYYTEYFNSMFQGVISNASI